MNILKLKLNPYKDINIASLDDKPLSPYSELSNYLREPFLKWAGKFLEAAEREINDDYQLIVIGEEFEKNFLRDMQSDFDACQDYKTESFSIPYSVNDRYNLVDQLLQKCGISVSMDNYRIPYYTDIQFAFNENMVLKSDANNAMLFITDKREMVDQISRKKGAAIIVLVSNRSVVSNIGEMQYLWEIEEDRLREVVTCIIDRFVKVPFIIEAVNVLKNQTEKLQDNDMEQLALSTEIDMFVSVSDVKDIEVGKSAQLKIKTIPDSGDLPQLRITTSNASILSVDGLKLTAVAPGSAYIEVYRAEEMIPFARKKVRTLKNNFVQSIRLGLRESKMGIGRTQSVNIVLVPEDAEDIHRVEWSVSDSKVASVDKEGNVRALAAGKVVVTAATSRVRESVEIEILPNISNINVSVTHSDLYVGETQPISVSVAPRNCFDSSYKWKTSDKTVAIVEKLDDGSSVIRATGIGNCILTCVAAEGNCFSTCTVNVEATFKKKENMHGMLSTTLVCMIAAVFCAAVSFSIGAIAATVATVACGVMAIEKNKSDTFWSLLLMVITVLVALETLGIIDFI